MNMWRIAVKEMKSLRDPKMVVFMLATPVLIILILGTALTNAFNGSAAVGDIRVLYRIESADAKLVRQWEAFAEESGSSGVVFEPAAEDADGSQEVRDNRYTGYVELTAGGIRYEGNSRSTVESGIVQGMLSAFADHYRLTAAAPETFGEDEIMALTSAGGEYVRESAVPGTPKPGALDYFAIAMTTLIILYSALTAARLIDGERKRNTAQRLLAAPVSKIDIFTGKIVGNFAVNAVMTILIILMTKYMFNVNWGDNPAMVLLVLFSEITFALSLGLGISYLLKGNAAGAVIMIIIQVGALVGGSYAPVESTTGFLREAAAYSPLHWSNEALLQIIYAGDMSAAVQAMALNIGCSIVLLAIAVFVMRRREGL